MNFLALASAVCLGILMADVIVGALSWVLGGDMEDEGDGDE